MGEWVDFKSIREAVSLQGVLDRYAVKLRRSGKELRGKCPIHKGEGADSFHVSETGLFHCFSCGAKGAGALDFVAAMEQCSIREAGLKLQAWFGASTPPAGEPGRGKPVQPATKKELVPEERAANKPLGFALKGVDPGHPYLAGRGLSRETAETFGIGFFSGKGSMASRVVIPIHNAKGELVAYAGRAIDDTEPKYKLPAGFKKSLELYNLHRRVALAAPHSTELPAVIVVEGFFDCMKVWQAGFWSVVALMGSALSAEQEKLLVSHFSQVTLMLDGDEAGRKAAEEMAGRLVRKLYVRIIALPEGKQPDMLSAGELEDLLKG